MPKKKTKKQEEQDLKDAMSYFKELAPPDEDSVTDTKLDNDKDDKPSIDYFKDLAVTDDEPSVDITDVKLESNSDFPFHSLIKKDKDEKDKLESLQSFVEELQDQQDEADRQSLLPTRLQEMRHMVPSGVEESWIKHIWNGVITAKLLIKRDTKNRYTQNKKGNRVLKQRYRKTNETDKVSSYKQLRNRYKNKRTWQAMELRIRKIGFFALGMGNTTYNANEWCSFIMSNQDVDMFDDIAEDITEQLDNGFTI